METSTGDFVSWSPCIVYARSLSLSLALCLLAFAFSPLSSLLPASWYLHMHGHMNMYLVLQVHPDRPSTK